MKIVKYLCVVSLLLVLTAGAGAAFIYYWATDDLPGFKSITDYNPSLVTSVYSRNGEVLGHFYRERRFLVPLSAMSPYVVKSFLAAEDTSFYQHKGVDLPGIARAAIKNLIAGGIVQGGSTITQQVVKSLLLTPERSYKRKIREAVLAYRLENYLTKDEILTLYLNEIYMGAGSYGVEAAAQQYFACHATELTLAQAALLAGLPKAPSRYDPYRNPDLARKRQMYVLERLRTIQWITEEEYAFARDEMLEFKSLPDPSWTRGAYYLEEVRQRLIAKFGEEKVYTAGLQVYTGLDFKHQESAEKALRNGLRASSKRRGWQGPVEHLEPENFVKFLQPVSELEEDAELAIGQWQKVLVVRVEKDFATVRFGEKKGVINVNSMGWARVPDEKKAPEDVPKICDATKVLAVGDVVWASVAAFPEKEEAPFKMALEQLPAIEGALISIEPQNGQVVAMVGGYDFFRSQFNRATKAWRQPGSAFKPIVYSTALDSGMTAASVVLDAPIVFENEDEETWKPRNFEGVFFGPTLLRTALVKSRNLVTVRIAQQIGIRNVIKRARQMGIVSDFKPNLALSLGASEVTPLSLCTGYMSFARLGTWVEPEVISRVESAWGEVLYEHPREEHESMSKQTAYIMTRLLQAVVSDGTGWRARAVKRPVAAKTGTSNNEQDAWFIGFTPYLLTGVYVGFDQVRPMGRYETGSRAAAPIWVNYRKAVEQDYPEQNFVSPPDIVMTRIDPASGKLAAPESTDFFYLPFKKGTEPTVVSRPVRTVLPGQSSGESPQEGSSENILKNIF